MANTTRNNTFLLKRSNVPNKVPSNGQLLLGELAINTADVKLYASGTTSNSVLQIGWDRVARTGDTMTGLLTISGGGGTDKLFSIKNSGGTEVAWINASGTADFKNINISGFVITGLTEGQVVFANSGGTLTGSNKLTWDNTNGRLGVNTTTNAGYNLDVNGIIRFNNTSAYNDTTNSLIFSYPNVTNWIGDADKGVIRITSTGRFIMTDRYSSNYFGAGLHVNRLYTNVNIGSGLFSYAGGPAGLISSNAKATSNTSDIRAFDNGIGVAGGVINSNSTIGVGVYGIGQYISNGYTANTNAHTYGGYFESGTQGGPLSSPTLKSWTGVYVSVNPSLTNDTASVGIGLNVNVAGTYTKYAALFNGGNVGIGNSAPAYRLDVTGTAGVSSDLAVGGFIYPISTSNSNLLKAHVAAASILDLGYYSGSQTASSGTKYMVFSSPTFSPSGGFAGLVGYGFNPTVSQSGSAAGVTRGLYINPTLTSAVDWRSIEWSNNSGWGLYGAGTASNYLAGNTLIGTTTDSGYKLNIQGSVRIGGDTYFDTTNNVLQINKKGSSTLSSYLTLFQDGNNRTFTFYQRASVFGASVDVGMEIGAGYLNVPYYQTLIGALTSNSNAKLIVTGNITAVSGLSHGVYFNNTLVAAANNDTLIGLDIKPTFTNGAYTGVTNYALRVSGASITNATSDSFLSHSYVNYSDTYHNHISFFKSNGTSKTVTLGDNGASAAYPFITGMLANYGFVGNSNSGFHIYASSSVNATFFTNGNVGVGTTTDAGYKLDVNGTGRFTSRVDIGTVTGGAPGNLNVNNTIQLWGTNPKITSSDAASGIYWFTDEMRFLYYGGAPANTTFAFGFGNSPGGGVYIRDVNSGTRNSSAKFQIDSTTLGFLPPRMTQAQRNAIVSAATGLVIYQTDNTEGLYEYASTGWRPLYNIGSITGSGATNQVTFWNSSNGLSGSTNFVYDSTTSSLTVGGTTPTDSSVKFRFVGGFYDARLGVYNTSKEGVYIGTFGSGASVWGYNYQSGTPVKLMLNESGGNVLIGTTTDAGQKLQIKGAGTTSSTTSLLIQDSANTHLFSVNDIGHITVSSNQASKQARFYVNGYTTYPFLNASSGGVTLSSANNNNLGLQGSPIQFYNGSGSNELMRLFATGNLILQSGGTLVDAGYKLDVNGDIRGTGNLYLNSTGGTSVKTITPYWGGTTPYGLKIEDNAGYVNDVGNGYGIWLGNAYGTNYTAGTYNQVMIDNSTFYPSAGSGVYNYLTIYGIILQMGGNGITRGLYVNATIASAADWRSIEWTNYSGWGLYGSGSAKNYLNGNLLLGTTTDAGQKLQVNGSMRVGSTAASAMYWDDSNSRLGIGTSSPTSILHVTGSSSSPIVLVENRNNASIVNILDALSPNLGAGYTSSISIGVATRTNDKGRISFNYAGAGSFSNSLGFSFHGGSELLTITAGGRIGVANTSPTARLDINASTTSIASLRIRSGVAPTSPNDGDIWNDGNNIGINISGTTSYLTRGSGTTGQVTFWSGTSAVTGSSNFTWDSTNDGLTIKTQGTSSNRGLFVEQYSNGVQSPVITFKKARGTIASPTNVSASDLIGAFPFSARVGGTFTSDRSLFGANMATSTGIGLFFIASSSDGTYAPSMYIHPSGNVGINPGGSIITGGITDGGQRLQVIGSMRVGTTAASAMYWDDTNSRLGIGTSSPTGAIEVVGSIKTASNSVQGLIRMAPNNVAYNGSNQIIDFCENYDITNSGVGLIGITNTNWGSPSPSVSFVSTRNGTGTTKDIMFWAQSTPTTSNQAIVIKANTNLIGLSGITSPTAILDISPSTTSAASLRIRQGTAPTSPNSGDIWFNGSDLYASISGVTKSLTASGATFGTGAAGQVTYWNSTSGVTGSTGFTWDDANKRLGIGTSSPASPLHVVGQIRATGGFYTTGTNTGYACYDGASGMFFNGSTLYFQNYGNYYSFTFAYGNYTANINNGISVPWTINPTSGNGIMNVININPTINQTGGASGVTRGLYVAPTLTSAYDWRSIEWSNNSGWGLYGAGTAKNYLAGNTLIGTTTDSGYKLDVNGATMIRGQLNINYNGMYIGYASSSQMTFNVLNNTIFAIYDTEIAAAKIIKASKGFVSSNGNFVNPTGNYNSYITGNVTATSGLARGTYWDNTLIAAANNDTLVGVDIAPTFTNGAYTGVTNYALRVSGGTALVGTTGTSTIFSVVDSGGTQVASIDSFGTATFKNINISGFGITGLTEGQVVYAGSGNTLNGSSKLTWDNTNGRLGVNTSTSAGYNLDVNGTLRTTSTARFQGDVTIVNNGTFTFGYYSMGMASNTLTLYGGHLGTVLKARTSSMDSQYNTALYSIGGTDFYGTSGIPKILSVNGTISSTNTAGYTGLEVSVSDTGTGTGAKNLLRLIQNSVSRFNIADTGGITSTTNTLVSSSGGAAYYLNPTLTASSNNSTLIGLDLQPVFASGVYTGLTTYGLRVNSGDINFENPSTVTYGPTLRLLSNDTNSTIAKTTAIEMGSRVNGNNYIRIDVAGTGSYNQSPKIDFQFPTGAYPYSLQTNVSFRSNGNVLIGTTTDSGYKLDVNGAVRIKGPGTTSATNAFVVTNNTAATNTSLIIRDDGTFAFSNPNNGVTYMQGYNNGEVSAFYFTAGLDLSAGRKTTSRQYLTSGSVTASGGIAQTAYFNNTLVAAANNDVLVGLDINPTFTNGAYTGVTNYALRVLQGDVFLNTQVGIGTAPVTAHKLAISGSINISSGFIQVNRNLLPHIALNSSGANYGLIQNESSTSWSLAYGSGTNSLGTAALTWFGATGNVGINTTTDNGYKLDVNGTGIVRGYFEVSTSTLYALRLTGSNRIIAGHGGGGGTEIDMSYNSTYKAYGSLYIGTLQSGTFTLGNNNTTAMAIVYGNNIIIQSGGTYTDAGYRLDINGTGASTGALRVTNGNVTFGGSTGFTWDNTNGRLGIGIGSPSYSLDVNGSINTYANLYMFSNSGTSPKRISPYWGSTTPYGLQIDDLPSSIFNVGNGYGIQLGNRYSASYTAGSYSQVYVTTNNFNPTSGTGVFNFLDIYGAISQTGGANGITRGLYIHPSLVSAVDYRTIEWNNNTGWGLYGAGTAKNYLAGNTLIGTTTDSGYKLSVNGKSEFISDLRINGSNSSNNQNALAVYDVSNNALFKVANGGRIYLGNSTTYLMTANGNGSYSYGGANYQIASTSTDVTFGAFQMWGDNVVNTSGLHGHFGIKTAFAPTSGAGQFAAINIISTINQTGGASGVTRGLYINPTLTSAYDWRAIEVTSGATILAPSTTGNTSLRIQSGSTPTTFISGDIWNDGSDVYAYVGGSVKSLTSSGTGSVGGTGTTGQIAYWSSSTGITGSNNLFWDSAKNNLGVGSSLVDSSFKLGVQGTIATTGYLNFQGSNGLNNNTGFAYMGLDTNSLDIYVALNRSMKFFVGNEVMRLFSTTGNLVLQSGGAFTDAGYKLDVNGTARFGATTITGTTNLNGKVNQNLLNQTYFGYQAGLSDPITGYTANVGLGYQAMAYVTTGSQNAAVGYRSQYSNVTGTDNTSIGHSSLYNLISGQRNTAIGFSALFYTTGSSRNTAVGWSALNNLTAGTDNTAIGEGAIQGLLNGSYNFAGGENTINGIANGSYNTAIGAWAGRFASTGTSTANTSATSSIYIGFDTRPSATGNTNEIVIGNSAIGNGSNTLILGNTSITATTLQGTIYGSSEVLSGNLSVNGSVYVNNAVNWGTGARLSVQGSIGGQDLYLGYNSANGYIYNNNGSAYNITIGTNSVGTQNYIGLAKIPSTISRVEIGGGYTATGSIGRGTYIGQTLTAAANNDKLFGVDIQPTFVNGAYTNVTNTALRVVGSSTFSAVTGTAVTIVGSGSSTSAPIFSVQGSSGELFSVTDSLTGSLFSVNDISGLPILEAFSDNTVLMGSYQAPSLNTTVKITANSGSTTIYSVPTSAYTGAFFDYTVMSSAGARSGNVMAIWSGTSVQYTETSTNDIGDTNSITFSVGITGSTASLISSATTNSWTVKTIVRAI